MPPLASSNLPNPIRFCVGEGSLYVAEQFAFKDALRQASHIDRDHRVGRPIRQSVDGSRDHFFPGSMFAGNQNIGRPSARSNRFSASSRCSLRRVLQSSIWVLTIASSRGFSHGF